MTNASAPPGGAILLRATRNRVRQGTLLLEPLDRFTPELLSALVIYLELQDSVASSRQSGPELCWVLDGTVPASEYRSLHLAMGERVRSFIEQARAARHPDGGPVVLVPQGNLAVPVTSTRGRIACLFGLPQAYSAPDVQSRLYAEIVPHLSRAVIGRPGRLICTLPFEAGATVIPTLESEVIRLLGEWFPGVTFYIVPK